MDNSKIEQLFEEVSILKPVTSRYGARLFGGFIRDVDTGRMTKDIDILVSSHHHNTVLFKFLGDGWSLTSAMHESVLNGTISRGRQYMDINGKLKTVVKARKDGWEVDLLLVNCCIADYIKLLPISTSLASAYHGFSGVTVVRPDDYLDSLETKQITISDSRINEEYVAKMKEYYPDWLVVIDSDCEDDVDMEQFLVTGERAGQISQASPEPRLPSLRGRPDSFDSDITF